MSAGDVIGAAVVLGCFGAIFYSAGVFIYYGYQDCGFAIRRRWKRANAQARRGACYCGKPVTTMKDLIPMRAGSYAEFWSCSGHANVPATTPWANGRPMIQGEDGVWHEPIESLIERGLVRVVEPDEDQS